MGRTHRLGKSMYELTSRWEEETEYDVIIGTYEEAQQ